MCPQLCNRTGNSLITWIIRNDPVRCKVLYLSQALERRCRKQDYAFLRLVDYELKADMWNDILACNVFRRSMGFKMKAFRVIGIWRLDDIAGKRNYSGMQCLCKHCM